MDYDVFYLVTAAASVQERGNHAYLLRVGRGRPADSESSVLVKIADMTAKYGEDYVVRVRDERTKVDNPKDNFSLMELMEDSDFEQLPISDSDEFADMMGNDPDARAAYQEGIETALEFLGEASGLKEKYGEDNPYSEALEELYGEDTEPAEDSESGEDADAATDEAVRDDPYTIAADAEAAIDWDEGAIPATESGDAIVYYIKSERVYVNGDGIGGYINPYTNDSVVSYMLYSAQGVEVNKAGNTVTEHWLFDYYYPGEMDHDTSGLTEEEIKDIYDMLISFFGGQRFLDGPVNDANERYAIPDFTAIGYDGLSICAYTIDPDGSSDTDADKELYLQVYDFQNHRTKYQTILTNDNVADTLPQLFHSRVNTGSGSEAHTKLFWYRDGKQVVYIDVTELLATPTGGRLFPCPSPRSWRCTTSPVR